jgi:diguanylate cyclase (GGDEF)-like protein
MREQVDFAGDTSVVTIVFALAVANLGLGFALAVALDRFPVRWIMPGRRAVGSGTFVIPEVHGKDVDELPDAPTDEWSRMLREAEVEPKSIAERLLWIVKLGTIVRREKLVELDRAFFDPLSPQLIADELKQELESFHQLLESWISEAGAEKEHAGQLCEALAELLLGQATQLRGCIDGLAETSREDVARHLAAAMNAVNLLRDRADGLLCEMLTTEDRLHCVADRHRTFGGRNTLNRVGLAALFNEWWADDPDHVRLVSIAMLDLDQFELFNCQVGTARGDVALLRLGDILHDLVRKGRGFDRVARYSGQRFVLFLGDTSAKNAAKGAERFRQTIEATSFKIGEASYQITGSLAVIEVGKTETVAELIMRLEATLFECKNAGRNCGYVDSGGGPVPIKLPQYQVSGSVIELDA